MNAVDNSRLVISPGPALLIATRIGQEAGVHDDGAEVGVGVGVEAGAGAEAALATTISLEVTAELITSPTR
jgi:hypothetical protein